jgi:hypothetical protein
MRTAGEHVLELYRCADRIEVVISKAFASSTPTDTIRRVIGGVRSGRYNGKVWTMIVVDCLILSPGYKWHVSALWTELCQVIDIEEEHELDNMQGTT